MVKIKKQYVAMFAMLFIFYAIWLINGNSLLGDEIWCYGFTKHIADGYVPYRDYNLIVTPLFFFIGIVFSKSLILFRVYGALIDAAIVLLTYYSCKINQVERHLALLITLITGIIMTIIGFANYNTLLLLGLMLLYLVTLRFLRYKDAQTAFLFGFLMSIILMIKQNLPFVLIVIFTIMQVVMLLRREISSKTFINYAMGVGLPVIIFTSWSLLSGSLNSFVDYTILGILTFSNNYYVQKESLILICIATIIAILIIKGTLKAQNDKFVSLTNAIFCLSSFLLIYPLVDVYHSCLILIFNIFLAVNILKYPCQLKYTKPIITGLIAGLIIICLPLLNLNNEREGYVRSKIDFYNNILIKKDFEDKTFLVSNYVKEQEEKGIDVAIINSYAYWYNIPARDFNGILDLLYVGNMGTVSNDEIMSLIDEKDIILTNEHYDYQDIKEVREYVLHNYAQIGKVGDLGIYIKPR